jgi:hypothetical protein
MMISFRALLFLLLAASQGLSVADERIKLEQTTVIDNHELPKITYIVPWQAAHLPKQEAPPLDDLIDDALTPLDRDVLRNRIQYYYEVTPAAQTPAETPETSKKP